MTGLDTITQQRTQPTHRMVDSIESRSRHGSDASSSPGTSFDEVFERTSHDAESPSSRLATGLPGTEVREQRAETADPLDAAESADDAGAESAEPTDALNDHIAADALHHPTQGVAAGGGDTAAATATAAVAEVVRPAEVVGPFEIVDVADAVASAMAGDVHDAAGSTPSGATLPSPGATATPTTVPTDAGIESGTAVGSDVVTTPLTAAVASVPDTSAVRPNTGPAAAADAAGDGLSIVAATSTVSADDATGGDVGTDAGADSALLQAVARAAEDAAPRRPADVPNPRVAPLTVGDAGAASDLAGLDASSGDQAAPEITPTLTGAQRGAEASTRLTEHVAMRAMFDRIERHRSSIDGSIELEILTERFGSIRIEAVEGRDGVHLSLRGGNGDERALADLADELRQEFERNGTDLAGVDVGDGKRDRSRAEPIEGSGDPLAGVGDAAVDDSPLHRLGGAVGRLDLRL